MRKKNFSDVTINIDGNTKIIGNNNVINVIVGQLKISVIGNNNVVNTSQTTKLLKLHSLGKNNRIIEGTVACILNGDVTMSSNPEETDGTIATNGKSSIRFSEL